MMALDRYSQWTIRPLANILKISRFFPPTGVYRLNKDNGLQEVFEEKRGTAPEFLSYGPLSLCLSLFKGGLYTAVILLIM